MADDATLASAWAHVIDSAPTPVKVWVKAAKPLALHESTLLVAVPNDFSRERIASRNRDLIEGSLTTFYGRAIHIAVSVDSSLEPDDGDADLAAPELPLEVTSHGLGASQVQAASTMAGDRLNPKYTFENFVIGSSNRFAHAAAVAVAEAPGKSYNPLMIYGPSGLGKTHLLHGIGHYVPAVLPAGAGQVRLHRGAHQRLHQRDLREPHGRVPAHLPRHRRAADRRHPVPGEQDPDPGGVLPHVQHAAQRAEADRDDLRSPPKALEALEPRLRSRFEWGLLTDIQPPDLETRIAILRKKASAEHLMATPEVLEFIADKIATNIRELEGALIRVTAFASLNHQPVDLRLAEEVLKDLIPEGVEAQITPPLIMTQTANYFNITIDDLCGPARTHVLVTARQIAMYLCRELTDFSLPAIGRLFGGRDHTTVMHANKKIRQLMAERRTIYNQVTELTNRIKQAASAR
jgi:chromosomal replication initiator protein